MNLDEFVAVAATVVDSFDPLDIDRPVEGTGLDSLDLMRLRAALEARLGTAISDDAWFSSKSFAELLARLP